MLRLMLVQKAPFRIPQCFSTNIFLNIQNLVFLSLSQMVSFYTDRVESGVTFKDRKIRKDIKNSIGVNWAYLNLILTSDINFFAHYISSFSCS